MCTKCVVSEGYDRQVASCALPRLPRTLPTSLLTHATSLTHTPRSVLEHLELVAAIKGVPGSAACRAAAQEMAGVVGLGAAGDAGALSKNLSGGMKRKLQVGPAAGAQQRHTALARHGGSKLAPLPH